MDPEQLAQLIANSIARHQSRGLVDGAKGMHDVVIHGRADLLAVAEDVIAAHVQQTKLARRSWAPWFSHEVDVRHKAQRQERLRARLAEHLENGGLSAVEEAITRLRMRDLPA
ncbi:hypothetical protein NT2_07_00500 [Caenibius tardaugens NBRC 16725]|uniref:Uncharacterized protein n=1 Tax=Caenibius tardaugens NBRC 16725 TaxID=1219035 RepID=U2YMQ5_9SPHN|nr:hypothetical protein [Caenibius tardaugens]AZI35663.1 hypothetical protein EGO55_06520 [Caenibius tardaugens NBRC 16725]GAD50050.1 hypothetical protein NT2_07_00500 [Caenibius tardaugens NBRC 16725]